MAETLDRVDTLNAAVRADMKRENAAPGQVTCLSFCRILRWRSIHGILWLRMREKWHKKQRGYNVENEVSEHRSNETQDQPRLWQARIASCGLA